MDRHVQKLVDAVHDVLPDELKEHAGVVTASVCALAWTLILLNSDTDACPAAASSARLLREGRLGCWRCASSHVTSTRATRSSLDALAR